MCSNSFHAKIKYWWSIACAQQTLSKPKIGKKPVLMENTLAMVAIEENETESCSSRLDCCQPSEPIICPHNHMTTPALAAYSFFMTLITLQQHMCCWPMKKFRIHINTNLCFIIIIISRQHRFKNHEQQSNVIEKKLNASTDTKKEKHKLSSAEARTVCWCAIKKCNEKN